MAMNLSLQEEPRKVLEEFERMKGRKGGNEKVG